MSKNLKYNKKIKEETEAFTKAITSYTSKLKKEYEKEILNVQISLLEQIAEGEDLNIIELKEKYLQKNEKKKDTKTVTSKTTVTEELLEKTEIGNNTYFYENKDNGNVYNTDSVIVGSFINGEIKLNTKKSNKT